MRILDTLIAFPSLVLVLAIAHSFEPSSSSMVVALLFYNVPVYARIARASTLRLREQSFIFAAQLAGTSTSGILVRHLAPNIIPELIALTVLGIGVTIVIEGAMNFLGLGVPPPAPSWGGMIRLGQEALSFNPSLVLLPGTCLFITVWSLNHLGEALRSRWSLR
jgi:peptide/nickel transport system permease protein